MGYDIYITRRKTWHDFGPPTISLAEWKSAASRFPDLVAEDNESKKEESVLILHNEYGSRYFGSVQAGIDCLIWRL